VSAAASAASAASSYDQFDDRYLGSKTSNPTVDNDGNALVVGALYYNSVAGKMRVYDGAQWIDASASSQAILVVYQYTATGGQTTFSGTDNNSLTLGYTVGSALVTLNGVMLEVGSEVTATSGTSVVLASGATAGDELNVYAFSTFNLADVYTKAQSDAKYVDLTSNQSIAGNKNFAGNTLYVDDTNDRVGVGTNSPLQKLDMNGTTARFSNGSYTGYLGAGSLLVSGGSSDFTLRSDNVLSFGTGGPYERMRIDASGRITTPAQPAFRVYNNTTLSPSNGTTVVFNTVYWDVGSNYSTSTGRFTAPVTGYYVFFCTARPNTISNAHEFEFRKNGSRDTLQEHVGSATASHQTLSAIIYLVANDYVTVQAVANMRWDGGIYNGFSGYLLG
jgi:hypothetical protein